jgi:hypothetical protein
LSSRWRLAGRWIAGWWDRVVSPVVAAGDDVPGDGGVGDVADEMVSVDDAVVSSAQQREVGEVGLSRRRPNGSGGGRRTNAPVSCSQGSCTPIPQPQGRQLPRRRETRRAALIEDLPAATEDGRDDRSASHANLRTVSGAISEPP